MDTAGIDTSTGDASGARYVRAVRTAVLVVAVLCVLTTPLAPDPYLMRALQTLAIAGTSVVALLRWRHTRQRGWAIISGASAGWFAAMLVGWLSQWQDSGDLLRVARGLFGIATIAGAVGLVVLFRPEARRQTAIQLLDAVVVASALAIGLSVGLQGHVDLAVVAEELGNPGFGSAMALIMAALALTAAVDQPSRPLPRWLALGLGVSLAGDLMQLVELSNGDPDSPMAFTALFAAGSLLILVGVLTGDRVERFPPPVPRWRRGLLTGVVAGALVVAVADLAVHEEFRPVTVVAVLFLVLAQSAALLLALSDLHDEARTGARVLDQLRISQARLAATLDTAPVGIGVVAEHGTIVLANAALADLVGLHVEDLIGRRWQDFIAPLDDAPNGPGKGSGHRGNGHGGRLDRGQDGRGQGDRGHGDPGGGEVSWLHRFDGRDLLVEVTTRGYPTAGNEEMWLGSVVDVSDRIRIAAELAHRANHDELTDLANRHHFSEQLEEHISAGGGGVLVVLDLDQFKYVNDTLGHSAGDALLVATAGRLRQLAGQGCAVARIGGDEFCILTPPGLRAPLETVAGLFGDPFDIDGEAVHTTASLGGTATRTTATAEDLIAEADAAMYRAKALGPGRREMYLPSTGASMAQHHRTVGELHRALEEGQFELWFQPVLGTRSRRVEGFETLVRWQHPERGMLTPADFVPVAEHAGLIVPLGRWVLDAALARASSEPWASSNTALAINVSAGQIAHPSFVDTVAGCLETSGFAPDRLWLEITESALLTDQRTAARTCARLVDLGVHLAIDDFGTGFGSLTYLVQFPVEAIKVDRSFVAGVGSPPAHRRAEDRRGTGREHPGAAIVASLLGLADQLGLLCIAEGVERPEQLLALQELGCALVQGHLLGRPSREPEFRVPEGLATPRATTPLQTTREGV